MKPLLNFIIEQYGFAPMDKQILMKLESELNSELKKCKSGEQRKLWEDAIDGKGPLDRVITHYKMEIGEPTTGNIHDTDFRWLFCKGKKVAFIEFDDDYTGENGYSAYIHVTNY